MDRSKGILLWVAGFAGVLLIYGAYKNQKPLTIIQGALDGSGSGVADAATTASAATDAGAMSVSGGFVYDGQGNPVAEVPAAYKNNEQLYIPSRNMA